MTFRAPLFTRRLTGQSPPVEVSARSLAILSFIPADNPFRQSDWPNPQQRRQAGGITIAANLLLAVLSVAPFVQDDWPKPQVSTWKQEAAWVQNLQLTILSRPFSQSEWQVASRTGRSQKVDDPLNLLGTTLAPTAVVPPFIPIDFPIQRAVARAFQIEQQNLLLTTLGGGGGSTVIFFNGVSTAPGVSYHKGISRPTISLADAGGGTYTVTKTHSLSGNLKGDRVSAESYLIDGELP